MGVPVGRLLAAMLILAGPMLMAAPADAATRVSIAVSTTTLVHGSPATFTGRVPGARAGTDLVLQRRAATRWVEVATRSLRRADSGTYRFTTTPSRGVQVFRVLARREPGQRRAVSRSVTLTVRWRPSLTVSESTHAVDKEGRVTTTVHGTSERIPSGTDVWREVRNGDGDWSLDGSVTVSRHTWADEFASAHGQEVRYTAQSDGARRGASSAAITVDGTWTPTVSVTHTMDPLTDAVTVHGRSTGLAAGTTVQRQRRAGDSWVAEGEAVPVGTDGAFSDAFAVILERDYRYHASASGLRREVASPPLRINEAPTGRIALDSTVEVVIPADGVYRTLVTSLEEGQSFTLHGEPWTTLTVSDPTGATVAGFPTKGDDHVTGVAPRSGDYVIRLEAAPAQPYARSVQVTLSQPVVVDTTLDAPGVALATSLPGQVVDVRFEADGDSVVSEYSPVAEGSFYHDDQVTLLDPSGEVVPRWGRRPRLGLVWLLPAKTGVYTMRVTPFRWDRVDRPDQALLRGKVVTAAVDGGPAHLSLDRPGRVGVVEVTASGEADVRISDQEPSSMEEELFGPDGQLIETYSTVADILAPAAGTYRQLVSHRYRPVEVDYYASTPLQYVANPGMTTPYDNGDVPGRRVQVTVPVQTGDLFSFESLDDEGDFCSRAAGFVSGRETLGWMAGGGRDHPVVLEIAEDGELLFEPLTCTRTGSFRLVPTSISPSQVTSISTTWDGYPATTTEGTVETTSPGQVMVMEYDAGSVNSNRVAIDVSDTSLPPDTQITLMHDNASGSYGIPRLFHIGSISGLPGTSDNVTGARRVIVYLGPTQTGRIDLRLDRTDFRR